MSERHARFHYKLVSDIKKNDFLNAMIPCSKNETKRHVEDIQ